MSELIQGQDAVAGEVEHIETPAFHSVAAQVTVLLVPDVFEDSELSEAAGYTHADEASVRNAFQVVTAPDGKVYSGYNPFSVTEPKGIGYAAFEMAVRAAKDMNSTLSSGLILATSGDVCRELEMAVSGHFASLAGRITPATMTDGSSTELVKFAHRTNIAKERDESGKFAHTVNLCLVVRSAMAGFYNDPSNVKHVKRLMSTLTNYGEQFGVDVQFGMLVMASDLLNSGMLNALSAEFDFGAVRVGKLPLLYAFTRDEVAEALVTMPAASELFEIGDMRYDMLLMHVEGEEGEVLTSGADTMIDDLSDLDEPATVARSVASQVSDNGDLEDELDDADDLGDDLGDDLDDADGAGDNGDLEDELSEEESDDELSDDEESDDEDDLSDDVGGQYNADLINQLVEEITSTESRNERRAIARKYRNGCEDEADYGPLFVYLAEIADAQTKEAIDSAYNSLLDAVDMLAASEEGDAEDDADGADVELPQDEKLYDLGISVAEASIYEDLLTEARESGDAEELSRAQSDLRNVLTSVVTLLRTNAKELHKMADVFSKEERDLIAALHRKTISDKEAQAAVRSMLRNDALLKNSDVSLGYSQIMSSFDEEGGEE